MVKTLSCGLRDPGSIPGRGNLFSHPSPIPLFRHQEPLTVKSHKTISSTGTMLPSPFLLLMFPSHGMCKLISLMFGSTGASSKPPRGTMESSFPPMTQGYPSFTEGIMIQKLKG